MLKEYRYDGSKTFRLSKVSTDETSLVSERKKAESKMQKNFEEISELQKRLYAEKKEGVIFLKKHYADKLFRTPVARNVRLCEAPSYGMPIQYYDKYAKGGAAYDEIAEELLERI